MPLTLRSCAAHAASTAGSRPRGTRRLPRGSAGSRRSATRRRFDLSCARSCRPASTAALIPPSRAGHREATAPGRRQPVTRMSHSAGSERPHVVLHPTSSAETPAGPCRNGAGCPPSPSPKTSTASVLVAPSQTTSVLTVVPPTPLALGHRDRERRARPVARVLDDDRHDAAVEVRLALDPQAGVSGNRARRDRKREHEPAQSPVGRSSLSPFPPGSHRTWRTRPRLVAPRKGCYNRGDGVPPARAGGGEGRGSGRRVAAAAAACVAGGVAAAAGRGRVDGSAGGPVVG